MSANTRFIAACFTLLGLAWLFSGTRFLDAMFALPDLGPVDDLAIAAAVALEAVKDRLAPPDAFTLLRGALHAALGL